MTVFLSELNYGFMFIWWVNTRALNCD